MKKITFSLVLLMTCLLNNTIYSQTVGINTTGATADNSAILDLNTGNNYASPKGKGLLIPNVALSSSSDNVTISSPAPSLLVYVPSGSGLSAGYYYNAGTAAAPAWASLNTGLTAASATADAATTDAAVASTTTSVVGTFSSNSSTFTSTGASITLPAVAGTYLIMASAEILCVTGTGAGTESIYLTDGTHYYGNTTPVQNAATGSSYWTPWITSLTTTTTSLTYKVYIANSNTSTGSLGYARNVTISYVKIL